ncbi:MAG TPA: M48 family metallopeptidase [Xanthomonadales bacterium]|nr:M48 family metallopeptidase [Xanthomonadales bacterium]
MNFFEHQAKARRQTSRLVVLFGLAVAAIVATISFVIVFALELGSDEAYAPGTLLERRGGAMLAAAILTLAVIVFASLFKTGKLRAGGGVVARELGGTLVGSESTNPAHRRLRNVVEEIAIASGVPVPEIYVLDKESGINAFAAGYTPSDAAVAVTRGALEQLSRDELQGVIAHEFSHVLNGDMRLNIRLMGVLFGILVLAVAGREVLRHTRGGSGRKGGAIVLIALAVMIVGYVGLLFGRLIKASVSRQREFLADASAVQFTRQSAGIAGALKKIGGLPQGSKFEAADPEQASHMLFGDGVGYSSLFATHPPLFERIKRIDPRFDPRELEALRAQMARTAAPDAADAPEAAEATAGFAGAATVAERVAAPGSAADRIGQPAPADYAAAAELKRQIPEGLRVAAHMQDHAPAVVLALALDEHAEVRGRQLDAIAALLGAPLRDAAETLQRQVANLHPLERLPLAALAFPALRRRPRPYLEAFVQALERVIHADESVDLDEYCLAKLVALQVVEALDPSRAKVMGRRKLHELRAEAAALLATLARHGHADADDARRAYVAGVQGLLPDGTPPYAPPSDPIAALDAALPELDRLDPAGKELLIESMVRTMGHDGVIEIAEAELLRTVCAAMHCPMPPLPAAG